MRPYLQLDCILYVPLKQDYCAQPIVADQGLDLRTRRQTMEANSEQLVPLSVSLLCKDHGILLACPTFFRRSEVCIARTVKITVELGASSCRGVLNCRWLIRGTFPCIAVVPTEAVR